MTVQVRSVAGAELGLSSPCHHCGMEVTGGRTTSSLSCSLTQGWLSPWCNLATHTCPSHSGGDPQPRRFLPQPRKFPTGAWRAGTEQRPPPLRSLPPRSHPWPAAACQVCLPTATWPPSPSSSGAWPEHPATAARSSCAGQRLPGGKEGRGLLTRGHCRSWIKAESEHRLSPALEHPQLPHGPVDQGYGVLASVVGCVWGRKGSACWTADSHGIASSQCTRGAVWTQCPSSGASGLRLCHSRHLAGQFSPPV